MVEYHLIENHVSVIVKTEDDQEAVRTADLIQETFNSTSTGIRTKAGQIRLKELQKMMNVFYSELLNYRKNPSDERTLRTLKGLLYRAEAFSGFMRSFVRECGFEALLE